MTIDVQPTAQVEPETPPRKAGTRRQSYSLTWSGVWAVAQLDIRRRGRHGRSSFMLGLYTVVYIALAALAHVGASTFTQNPNDHGAAMFSVLVYLIMGVTFTIVPIISSARINGDALCGVLGELQRTRLTPAEIVVGKLVAGWVGVIFMMSTALPALLWAYLEGGTSIGRMLVVLAVLAGSLMAACAVGLYWSARVSNVGSAMQLTTLTVWLVVVGMPVLFALMLPLTEGTDDVIVYTSASGTSTDTSSCVGEQQALRRAHPQRIWLLVALSPLVIVADASPARAGASDPLSFVRYQMREVGVGPRASINECQGVPDAEIRRRAYLREGLPPIWPMGVSADVVITLLFVQMTIERLRTSSSRPPVHGSFS